MSHGHETKSHAQSTLHCDHEMGTNMPTMYYNPLKAHNPLLSNKSLTSLNSLLLMIMLNMSTHGVGKKVELEYF